MKNNSYSNNAELSSTDAELSQLLALTAHVTPRSNVSAIAQSTLERYIKNAQHSMEDRFVALQRFDFIDGSWDDSRELAHSFKDADVASAMVNAFCETL